MIHRSLLVLGGTGFLGRALCNRLVSRVEARLEAHGGGPSRIVVPTRRIARGRRLQSLPTVETVQADIHDDAMLARCVAGRDAVVNLVGILNGSDAEFDRAHATLPRRVAAACAAAGVRRIVHVSALGAGADAPSRYLRSKAAGEAALAASGLVATILRPSVIFGREDRLTNLFAGLSVFPALPMAGAAARFQPVWVEDVASAIAACLDRPRTAEAPIECVGPEQMTLAELVETCARLAGRSTAVIALPPALERLQARFMEWLPGKPMSRDNLASMQVANVASGTLPDLRSLGIEPASLAAVARDYLAGLGPRTHLDLLRKDARRDG